MEFKRHYARIREAQDETAEKLWESAQSFCFDLEGAGEDRAAARIRTSVRLALQDIGYLVCGCQRVLPATGAWDFQHDRCQLCTIQAEFDADDFEDLPRYLILQRHLLQDYALRTGRLWRPQCL